MRQAGDRIEARAGTGAHRVAELPGTSKRAGMALALVMVFVLAVSLLGLALMSGASINALETANYLNGVKAFWLAEAGVQKFDKRAFGDVFAGFSDTTLASGSIQVTVYSNASPPYVESVGTVQGAVKRIRIEYQYLSVFYRYGVAAANQSGAVWAFALRGRGNPVSGVGGRDIVTGNVYINGDVRLFEQGIVSNAIAPNSFDLRGDVQATGTIYTNGAGNITGTPTPHVQPKAPPDLAAMNYASNNTWDVKREYANAGLSSGRLPTGHPLRNVVVMNPSDTAARNDMCDSTAGDDFFFEPASGFVLGSPTTAATPLALGNDAVYYVDGHVWFNSGQTYGFRVSGKATIVATGDIHVSDNLKNGTTNSLLGLVAAGTYDTYGDLVAGGNVYFGDPAYGTMYTADAFMFAASNFLYNTYASGATPGRQMEPETGFQVLGNYAAGNQVKVYLDWYNASSTRTNSAWFDPSTNRWRDAVSNTVLTAAQTNTLRHYQMIVNYDERIRNQDTQPPRLPRQPLGSAEGGYGGITHWTLY